MRNNIITFATLFILGISGTFGALEIFATKGELHELAMKSQCADIEYQIDKVIRRMWEIEDRYDGDIRAERMNPLDRRRYQDLILQLEKFRNWQQAVCVGVG